MTANKVQRIIHDVYASSLDYVHQAQLLGTIHYILRRVNADEQETYGFDMLRHLAKSVQPDLTLGDALFVQDKALLFLLLKEKYALETNTGKVLQDREENSSSPGKVLHKLWKHPGEATKVIHAIQTVCEKEDPASELTQHGFLYRLYHETINLLMEAKQGLAEETAMAQQQQQGALLFLPVIMQEIENQWLSPISVAYEKELQISVGLKEQQAVHDDRRMFLAMENNILELNAELTKYRPRDIC